MKHEEIKRQVRNGYAAVATQEESCCIVSSCCASAEPAKDISRKIGYSDEELEEVPKGSNLGLGCGNPIALASLREGETVLDLGSGAGFDCFLASKKVGDKGRVIGVDMTPEMIDKARANASKGDYENVEFRLGEIENLPTADNSVDVVISNCVINLSTDKKRVFREIHRVLKTGGRFMISDIVLLNELPEAIKNSIVGYVGCISGAMMKNEYLDAIKDAGFDKIKITDEAKFPLELIVSDPTAQAIAKDLDFSSAEQRKIADSIASISVSGLKNK